MAGWLMVWADMVSASAVGLGFGSYFDSLLGGTTVGSGLVLLAVLTVLVWAGVRLSILVVSLFTLVEVGGLNLIIALGIPHWGEQALLEVPRGVSGIWAGGTLVFCAYLGFDELGNLAEEMRRPERDLPKAIAFAFVVSTILYALVAVSAVSLIG